MKSLISFILLVSWLAGITLAKGFWSIFFAIIFPLWAYYLVVEQLLIKFIL